MVSLFARATRRVGMTHIRYLTPVPAALAAGPVAVTYQQMERDFGMIAPPLALHAAAPDALAAVWLILRETLLVPGAVNRTEKEAVAAAVSFANRCPYCVDVHGATLAGLLRHPDAVAVATGRFERVADPRLRALVGWASAGGTTPVPVPYGCAHAPELIGVAVTFHYVNRMVNVFLRESPLPPVPGVVLGPVRRSAARVLGRLARTAPRPGTALDLLPEAPLPADLGWAAGRPHLAAAFARGSAAIDAGADRSVSPTVRRLVTAYLADPGATRLAPGTPPWLDHAVAGLPAPDRPAARLALLTAFASYRVTGRLVEEYRAVEGGDRALVELCSWASLAAARRVGTVLSEGFGSRTGA